MFIGLGPGLLPLQGFLFIEPLFSQGCERLQNGAARVQHGAY